MNFKRYIALGDSISIDLYPWRDQRSSGAVRKIGAASLFYRNDDTLWPEFRGRDIATLFPGCRFNNNNYGSCPGFGETDNFTTDGATTRDVIAHVEEISASKDETLVTLTAGGNDLLIMMGMSDALRYIHFGAFGDQDPPAAATLRVEEIIDCIFARRPNTRLLLSTVYDPTDGTDALPYDDKLLPFDEVAGWLREYNERLRTVAMKDARIRLADIHAHFLGHGVSAPETDRWYWREVMIEPNARGASEVRRVWLDAAGIEGKATIVREGRFHEALA